MNSIHDLPDELPRVFITLRRFLSEKQYCEIVRQYRAVDKLGANIDRETVREDGVSFNPRVARILSILLTDAGCRDCTVLVSAIWSCLAYDISYGRIRIENDFLDVPSEYRASVDAVIGNLRQDSSTACIRAVLDLDRIRHLHISSLEYSERAEVLEAIGVTYTENLLAMLPRALYDKLLHARSMQHRRLHSDRLNRE
jgi:hypothetical protein